MINANDGLPYTSGRRQAKRKSRPASDAFKAATKRLDRVNAMAGAHRAPAIIDLLSDNEHDDLALFESIEANGRDR
jgi:hypothetical protein